MNDRACDHVFIEFPATWPSIKRLVCAYCGHIRELSIDGEVTIIRQKGEIKLDYEQPKTNPFPNTGGGTSTQFG